jgi:SAM-dependent methyltransferase
MTLFNIIDWVTLIIQTALAIFMLYMMAAFFTGAPLVGTRRKMIKKILDEANLTPGKSFLDLGSGDGRVLEAAVEKYGIYGTGVEMNFFLVWYCRLRAYLKRTKNIRYIIGDFWKTDMTRADVIYTYLFPNTMEKLKILFEKNGKKGLLVITRIFEIKGWEKKLIKKIPDEDEWIYYYRK